MQATADNFVSVDTFVIAQTFVSLGIQFSIPMRYFSKIVIKSIIKVIIYDIIKKLINYSFDRLLICESWIYCVFFYLIYPLIDPIVNPFIICLWKATMRIITGNSAIVIPAARYPHSILYKEMN